MASGAGGSLVEEPPRLTRRERRNAGRRARRKARPQPRAPEPQPPSPPQPPTGARRARRRRAERRRFWLVIMPTVVGLLAVAVAVGAVVRSARDDDRSATSGAAAGSGSEAETLLLAHRGAAGTTDLLVLVGSDGNEASVLLVPTATQVEVPSLGIQALANLPAETALLRTTMENLLGVRVGRTVMLDDAGLAAALEPAAPLRVDLRRSVRFAEGDESLTAGPRELTAEEAARLLTAAQTGSELDRLVTVQAVLDAWFDRLRTKSVARDTGAVQGNLALLASAARARERRTDSLPVRSVATGGRERFEVRRDDLGRYVKAAFADALLGSGAKRPRVEILNGTGAVGVAQAAARRVVPAGGEVTLTGNVPGFGVEETQVVYYRDELRPKAEQLLDALGCGRLAKAGTAIGVVDVTILVGADCPAIGSPGS